MDTIIRRAGSNDLQRLLPLLENYHEFEHIHLSKQATEQALAKILTEEELGYVWLVDYGKQPIGYIIVCLGYSIEFAGRDAFVDEFFIEERYRGRGLGSKVLFKVKQELCDHCVNALHLEVGRNNHKARELYEKHDFKARVKIYLDVDDIEKVNRFIGVDDYII